MRTVQAEFRGFAFLILDGGRVGRIDGSARRLLAMLREMLAAMGKPLLLAGFSEEAVAQLLHTGEVWPADTVFASAESALTWCEDRLIAGGSDG